MIGKQNSVPTQPAGSAAQTPVPQGPIPAGLLAREEEFLAQLQEFLRDKQPESWCVAAIDIEHLKLFNEWYGVSSGDGVLRALSARLSRMNREQNYPAGYFGNDDFFLCMPNDDEVIQDVAARLQDCISEYKSDVNFFLVFGLCTVSYAPGNARTLCSYAQIAADSHRAGADYLCRFELSMLDQMMLRQKLLTQLEHGIRNREFFFYLQPKCNSVTRTIVGMEALVRWYSPEQELIPPSEFIPLLESSGLITQVDLYIWESVCQTLRRWKEAGRNMVPISVNVSIADIFNLNVAQVFSDLIEKYNLEPKLLLAEITESMMAQNLSVVENTVQNLHRKGFSVLMDDFGSGYSSLNMLKDTSVDVIKLDMKLIDLTAKNRDKGIQIVKSVVDMAHRLNLPIIAEGVETQEQVAMLQNMDCLYTQGYYFYKPMSVQSAEALLKRLPSEAYWDMHRDLLRRDRRKPGDDGTSEKQLLAFQSYQILLDNILEFSRLNLITGEYRVIKRDARLPGAGLEKEEQFETYCSMMVQDKIVHPDDAQDFLKRTNLETLRKELFAAQSPVPYRFRKHVSDRFIWITMEVLPCRSCSAQNPWAMVMVREDAQADLMAWELDFTNNHDTLTGVYNRNKYETDLRELPRAESVHSIACVYIDVIGLHEINNHLGHRVGDKMLCDIAKAAQTYFNGNYIYRIGGDEFVILLPNGTSVDAWTAAEKMRGFLRRSDYEISIGIRTADDPSWLTRTIGDAETAMRQEKTAYYERTGNSRQLRGLNEKLERILLEKHDTDQFLRVIAPRFKGVYVVDTEEDSYRCIFAIRNSEERRQQAGGSFRKLLRMYSETRVSPEEQEDFSHLYDYEAIRRELLELEAVRKAYTNIEGERIEVQIWNYSANPRRNRETLWIFSVAEVEDSAPYLGNA